jgi:hypothetical protein
MSKQAVGYPEERSLLKREMTKIVEERRHNVKKFEVLLKAALGPKKKGRAATAR